MSIFHELAAQEIEVERREYYSEIWKRTVYCRPFSAFKLQKLQEVGAFATDAALYTAKTVQLAIEDEEGNLIFRGHKKAERDNAMDYLMGKSYLDETGKKKQSKVTFEHLVEILGGLKVQTEDDLNGLIEAHEKKSAPTPADS